MTDFASSFPASADASSVLAVSLIVHDNYGFIGRALASLYQTTTCPFRVIVVINTGYQPQIEILKTQFPQVEYLINPQPLGFAANHNQVMRLTHEPYIALLNDDIELHSSALDLMVNYLHTHPEAALVGPHLLNPDGSQQVSVYSDPTLLRSLYRVSGLAVLTSQNSALRGWLRKLGVLRLFKVDSLNFNNNTRAVSIIKGAAMVVRRAAFEQVGGMDETTRAYGEEADWHLRLRQAGWQVVYLDDALITHFGAGQANLRLHGWVLAEDRKAILAYYLKHRPRWQALCVRWMILVMHSLWALLWLPFNRSNSRDHWQTVKMAATFTRTS